MLHVPRSARRRHHLNVLNVQHVEPVTKAGRDHRGRSRSTVRRAFTQLASRMDDALPSAVGSSAPARPLRSADVDIRVLAALRGGSPNAYPQISRGWAPGSRISRMLLAGSHVTHLG